MTYTHARIAMGALVATLAISAPPALAPAFAYNHHEAVRAVPFTQAAFEAAQAAGKPILVEVYAPWCPVCRAQQAGISAAQRNAANADLVVFRIDFDSQKAEQRPLRVTRQSTLIAFNGARETGRLLGDTNPTSIARLVETTRG
jgi:thiol:disulfide interchange protein